MVNIEAGPVFPATHLRRDRCRVSRQYGLSAPPGWPERLLGLWEEAQVVLRNSHYKLPALPNLFPSRSHFARVFRKLLLIKRFSLCSSFTCLPIHPVS